MDGISFSAIIHRIAMTRDGGWRVTLDVSDSDAQEMLKLTHIKNEVLQIGIIPTGTSTSQSRDNDATGWD